LEVEHALAKITADPRRFPVLGAKFQACSVERYPYQIVYRLDPHRVLVIAVAHAKRRPG
jgi:hypothetical protein